MKILFVCENYLPHIGGAEVVFKNLAEGYVKKGHQVTLLTHQMKGTRRKEEIDGVKVVRVPSWHSRYVFSFTAVPSAIRLAKKHDLIQTTTFNGAPPAWLASKLTKKPIVLTVHEVWIGRWQKITGFSWLKSKIHELLEKAIYLLPYDKYVSVSEATKKRLLKIGIDEKKIKTIHNGLDYKFWDPSNFSEEAAAKIRKHFNLNDKLVYFSWGRPGPTKGFEYLIKAIPKVKEKLPNFVLLLMLNKVQMHEKRRFGLLKMIRNLGLEDSVEVIDPVSYNELGNYLQAADYVVIPSTSEGFGYTTVEAAAMGKPLIVSSADSLPEVVSGKHLIFKNKDSGDLAEKIILAAQGNFLEKNLKKFEWETAIKKYLDLYGDEIC